MNSTINQPVPDGETPPLVWPEFTDEKTRLAWWRACVQAWLDQWDNPSPVTPATPQEIEALELRLGCAWAAPSRHCFAAIMNRLAHLTWLKRSVA